MTVILLSYGSQVPGDGNWRSLPGCEFTESWKLVKLPCTCTSSGKVRLLIIYQLWSGMKAYLLPLIWFCCVFFFFLNICTMLCSCKGIVRRLAFCHCCTAFSMPTIGCQKDDSGAHLFSQTSLSLLPLTLLQDSKIINLSFGMKTWMI